MPQYVRKTVISSETDSDDSALTVQNVIYFLFGVVEVLLLFRTLLKLSGANPGSAFVNFIYSVTEIFILPFRGIFPATTGQGVVTTSVLEPATLVAFVVYAFLAWGIVALIGLLSGNDQ